MGFRYRRALRWNGRNSLFLPVAVFLGLFCGTTYVLAPDAPGRAQLSSNVGKRFTDQHYRGCDDARANAHENIGAWEPSYRPGMDGDADGLACEPYRRGGVRRQGGWLGN
jgi:hypothetical protein